MISQYVQQRDPRSNSSLVSTPLTIIPTEIFPGSGWDCCFVARCFSEPSESRTPATKFIRSGSNRSSGTFLMQLHWFAAAVPAAI